MKHFAARPSSRREPRPTAAQLILGGEPAARATARGDTTLHLRPVTGRDHRKRYHPGQRLAVRPAMGAATICHVLVTDVRGPREQMTLGQITFEDARAAGYRTTLDLKRAWLLKHDASWVLRQDCDDPADIPETDIDARWQRHQHKPIWAVRYFVDITDADRLLAARSEELYVFNMARALPDEPSALSASDFERHVERREKLTTHQWGELEKATREAELEQLSLGQRLDRAVRECRAAGLSTTREIRVIEKRLQALENQGNRRAA